MHVHYVSIKDAPSKLQALYKIVKRHIDLKESLHIVTADKTSLSFVDEFLWKQPPDSFLPHVISQTPSKTHLITLSLPLASLDGISSLLNLTAQPILSNENIKNLYEIEDTSHPAKQALFQQKFITYQQAGYTLSLDA